MQPTASCPHWRLATYHHHDNHISPPSPRPWSLRITSRHVAPRHVAPRRATSRHVASRRATALVRLEGWMMDVPQPRGSHSQEAKRSQVSAKRQPQPATGEELSADPRTPAHPAHPAHPRRTPAHAHVSLSGEVAAVCTGIMRPCARGLFPLPVPFMVTFFFFMALGQARQAPRLLSHTRRLGAWVAGCSESFGHPAARHPCSATPPHALMLSYPAADPVPLSAAAWVGSWGARWRLPRSAQESRGRCG